MRVSGFDYRGQVVDRRYQVFISSTFSDLVDERREVMQALLELECLPAGMELFPAANEDQWTLIKEVINQCDYYLVIVGGRYGSTTSEGVSYTEKEYDYAVTQGIPVIGFVHGEPDEIARGKSDMDKDLQEKLTAFRVKVMSKMVKKYRTPEDLGSVVSRGVHQLIKRHPREGWVRGRAEVLGAAEGELKQRLVEEIEQRHKTEAAFAQLRDELLASKRLHQEVVQRLKDDQAEATKVGADKTQADLAEAFAKARRWEERARQLEEALTAYRNASPGEGRPIRSVTERTASTPVYVPDPYWRIFEDPEEDDLWVLGSTITESRASRVRVLAPRSYFDLIEGGYWDEIRGGFTGQQKSFRGSATDWGRSHQLSFTVSWQDPDGIEREEDVPGLFRPDDGNEDLWVADDDPGASVS